jgi:hypothetical protein
MNPNALNGAQLEILQEAILSAFTKPELDQLFSHGDRDEIDDSVAPGPFETQVLELIKLSQREGWTDWLISSIVEERPRNSRIRELVADLEREQTPGEGAQGPVTASEVGRPVTGSPASRDRGISLKGGALYLTIATGVIALVALVVVHSLGLWDFHVSRQSPRTETESVSEQALLACDTEEPASTMIDVEAIEYIGIFINTEDQRRYANKLRDDIIKLGFGNTYVEGPSPEFGGFPEEAVETRYFAATNKDNACRISVLVGRLGSYKSVISPELGLENASALRQVEIWFPDE